MNGIAVALQTVGALLSFLSGRPASFTDPACVAGAVASHAIVDTQVSGAHVPVVASRSTYSARYRDLTTQASEEAKSPDVTIGAQSKTNPTD